MIGINVVIIVVMLIVRENISSFLRNVTGTASNCVMGSVKSFTAVEYASAGIVNNILSNSVYSMGTIDDITKGSIPTGVSNNLIMYVTSVINVGILYTSSLNIKVIKTASKFLIMKSIEW